MIVRVRVILKKTVVGDWRFENLSGSHLQSQVNSVCLAMVRWNGLVKSKVNFAMRARNLFSLVNFLRHLKFGELSRSLNCSRLILGQFLTLLLCSPDFSRLFTQRDESIIKSVSLKISRIRRQKRKTEFFLFWPKGPIWLTIFGNDIKRFDFLFFSSKFAKL